MKPFDYARPSTIADALALLARGGARALAGGTDLIPQLREGRRETGLLVDLKHIPDLVAIETTPDGGLSIGAAATAAAVARHPRIAREYPCIASSSRLVGSLQVQNRASLGGNICNAAPSADVVPALICHGAKARIAGSSGLREVPLEMLATGPGRTALAPGEMLVAIVLPPVQTLEAADYERFTPRREMDIAVAGVASRLVLEAGRISKARIVLASVAPTPIRATSAESYLTGRAPGAAEFDEAARLAADDSRPISDTRGSADYRRRLVRVLTARTLQRCLSALSGQAREDRA